MANLERVALLKRSVAEWNDLRQNELKYDERLLRADFGREDLREVDLRNADLSGADLREANLRMADLSMVELSKADLSGADLSETQLNGANLYSSNLSKANLSKSNLFNANLFDTNLSGADLMCSNLSRANLKSTNLCRADLSRSDLTEANLIGSNLGEASLWRAYLHATKLYALLLTSVKGLETCVHGGPSMFDDSLLQQASKLPRVFLRGIGVHDKLIDYLPEIYEGDPIQYFKCFISYSRLDEEFVNRLHADLQDRGVRVWRDVKDLEWGAYTRNEVFQAIRLRDKSLVVLSENSIESDWVEDEVNYALAEEKRRKKSNILMPFVIDEILDDRPKDPAWYQSLKSKRNFGDFRGWRNHENYKKSLDNLIKWLRQPVQS